MRTARRPASIDELRELVGESLGPSSGVVVGQQQIDDFARLSGDDQWIHVDVGRAGSSEFGSTIGHGLLVLSLGSRFMRELLVFDEFAHGLNYGYDRVRFPAPVPVGSRVSMTACVTRLRDISPGVADVFVHRAFRRDGLERPVCVATNIGRFFEPAKGATAASRP